MHKISWMPALNMVTSETTKMDQTNNHNVKLVSLNIIDFKRLQKEIVSWNLQPDGLFDVINVKNFHHRTTLFQAFQFGFGHDTDAKQAEVIVTLQRRNQVDQVETWHFKHCKKIVRGQSEMTYEIQKDGVDVNFQVVDQKTYFDRFAEHKVSALTQSFCFGGSIKNQMATNNIDLRPFLEMYLMGEKLKNDYDEVDDIMEKLMAQKKAIAGNSKVISRIQGAFSKQIENRKNEEESDKWLLQLFFHHKQSKLLRDDIRSLHERMDHTVNSKCDELVTEIRKWDNEMDASGFTEMMKINKTGAKNHFDNQRKSIEDQIALYEKEIEIATSTNGNAVIRFLDAHPAFEHDNIELYDKLKTAQLDLFIAEFNQAVNVNPDDIRIEKKTGENLIGMNAIKESSLLKEVKDLQKDAIEKLDRAKSFDGEMYRFETGQFELDQYTIWPPTDGHCIVSSTSRNLHTRPDYDDDLNGGNHIIVHEGLQECKRPESNPFGCLITGDEASPHFEMIQAEAALQYAVSSIEKNDYTELFEAANYIKDKEYFMVESNDSGALSVDQKIHDLKNTISELEREMVEKYAEMGDIWTNLGIDTDPKSTIHTIDCFKRYQGIFDSNEPDIQQLVQQQIDRLAQTVEELKEHRQQLDNVEFLRLNYLDNKQEAQQEATLSQGKEMVNKIQKFVENDCIKSAILMKEAFLESTSLAIHYCNEQILNLNVNLPFDLKEETSPEAYLNCVTPKNACKFDDNASIDEIYKTIALQLIDIESNMEMKHESNMKDSRIFYDHEDLQTMAKKNKIQINKININLAAEMRNFDKRAMAFEERFLHFMKCFEQLMQKCSSWNMTVSISYDEPALKSPIKMLLCDPNIDFHPKLITTWSHQAAALLLKLAINQSIGSPILIFDSLDYIIEPRLISPIMDLLNDMAKLNKIQVIFMQINPQEELSATNTHHMWINPMGEEKIADTSDLVLKSGCDVQS